MKTVLLTLLVTSAITLTAAAAATPRLRIETIIADRDHVLIKPTLTISNGEEGFIRTGNKDSLLTYMVAPTLLDNDRVDIKVVITRRKGRITDKLASHMVVDLGKAVRIQRGELSYTATPTLEKLPGCR